MPKYVGQSTQDWDPARLPRLIGRILTREKGNEKMGERQFLTVDAGGATFRVYESKGLEDAFKLAEPGRFLDVQFLELVKLEGGRTFKRYQWAVFELEKGEAPPRSPEPRVTPYTAPPTPHDAE